MLAIIVGTHGNFSEELIKTCEMICGETTNIRAVTLAPGEGQEDILKKYEAAIQEMDTDDGVIFLNDLLGGSPYNVACCLAIHHATYGVVAGVNLPMLIEVIEAQVVNEGTGIKEMMSKAVEAGKAGTQMFHASTVEKEEEDL